MTCLTRPIVLCTALIASMLQAAPTTTEGRTWTNQEGREVRAELVGYDPATGKVTLKQANGLKATIAETTLCDADREFLRESRRRADEARAAMAANAGKTVSYRSEGEAKVGYHVYYPTSFRAEAPPPLLILFSPGGSGKGILAPVQAACEKMGWIGVGCDEFRNGLDDAALDPKWREVLAHIEKTVPHNRDLLYLGGMSGGALRAYDYTETTVRPWKGVLAFGGWLGGKERLLCPPKMAVAVVNGDSDKNANTWVEPDGKVLKSARCQVKSFAFPGGHVVAPPDTVLQALEWLKKSTVPGERLSKGKRSPCLMCEEVDGKKRAKS